MNLSEREFNFWLDKARRDGATEMEIVDYVKNYMISEFHEAPEYITDYVKSHYKVFNNTYNRNHSKTLELENKVMRDTLKQIESWTRNPREYEPSLYTINHVCREALNLIGGNE